MNTVLYINASGAISGAERSLLAMLEALDRAAWQPVLAAPDGPLLEAARSQGTPVYPVPLAPVKRPRSVRQGWAFLQALREGRKAITRLVDDLLPDAIHANTTSAMLYLTADIGVPTVWQVRDLVPLGPLGGKLYRHATRVAAISSAVRADLLRYGSDDGVKITILPPAVDVAHFQPAADKSALRQRLGLPVDDPLIGMVAQFVPWKRHYLFLDALERIADQPWHAVLAGANLHEDGQYLQTLRDRLERPPLAGRVTILPWQVDAAALLASLDICALTSQREPFGRVLIEAMACGVATVAVDEGGARDIILPEETGLLAPADADVLAAALKRLLADADERAIFARNGRDRAAAHFSLAQQRNALTVLYRSLYR